MGKYFVVKQKDGNFNIESKALSSYEEADQEAQTKTIENGANYGVMLYLVEHSKVVTTKVQFRHFTEVEEAQNSFENDLPY